MFYINNQKGNKNECKKIIFNFLNLKKAVKTAKGINKKTSQKIDQGLIIPQDGTFYDPGMKNIGPNGRTHGGRGFII